MQETELQEIETADWILESSPMHLSRLSALYPDLAKSIARNAHAYSRLSEIYAPWFLWQSGNISLHFSETSPNANLDKAIRLWNEGFRSETIVLPLVFYMYARDLPEKNRRLHEILTWKPIPAGTKRLLLFLFHGEGSLEDQKLVEIQHIRRSMALHNLPTLTRKKIRQATQEKEELIAFFQPLIAEKGSLAAQKKFGSLSQLDQERIHIEAGRIHKITALRESENAVEFLKVVRSITRLSREKESALSLAADFLNGRKVFDPKAGFEQWNPESLPWKEVSFYANAALGNWQQLQLLAEELKTLRKKFHIRFFCARAAFETGDTVKAWHRINELLADYPDNAAVLNEAGIYAWKLERFEEAEDIFSRARNLFPEHAATKFNEAVFFEKRSLSEIGAKWKEVELSAYP